MTRESNKRKKNGFKNIRKVISIIVVIFLCIYIPTIIILATSSKPDLEMLQNGAIKDYIKIEGLIFKEEQLYYAQFDGVFSKGATEGEKVPSGYKIASIVNKDYIELFMQLENLKKEIVLKKQNEDISSGIFTRDLHEIEENIKKKIEQLIVMVNTNKIEDINYYLEEINKYQKYRNEIIRGLSSNDIYVEDLEKQAKQLELSFKEQIFEIETVKSGLVTYIIDGFEKDYDYKEIKNYTPVDLLNLLNKDIKILDDSSIKAGKPFVKMIYGNTYYIGFVVDNDKANKIIENKKVTIEIKKPSITITSKNITIGKKDENNTCIYIEIDSKLSELIATRKIEANIILSEYYGFKVPLSALINIDSYPYKEIQLGIVKNNWVNFINVDIVIKDNIFAIIENKEHAISLYDYYVLKGEKTTEGQIVK